MDPIVDAPVVGRVKIIEGRAGAKLRILRAEIRAADHQHIDGISGDSGERLEILQRDLALVFEDLVHVAGVFQKDHIPFADVADALGVFEERGGHERDVTESGATDSGNHRAGVAFDTLKFLFPVRDVGFAQEFEFFAVVDRIEVVLIDWLLTDNRVEEITGGRHVPARRNGSIAFRKYVNITGGFLAGAKPLGHENDLSPRRFPFSPVFLGESEHRAPVIGGNAVGTKGLS